MEEATTQFITETMEESNDPMADLADDLPREASSYLVANVHASNTIASQLIATLLSRALTYYLTCINYAYPTVYNLESLRPS